MIFKKSFLSIIISIGFLAFLDLCCCIFFKVSHIDKTQYITDGIRFQYSLDITRVNRKFFWELTPDYNGKLLNSFYVNVNSLGFRGDEEVDLSAKKVVLLGDSCIFGWGVNQEETIPFYLQQQILKRSEEKIQIINAGVPGYSSFQGRNFLVHKIAALKPTLASFYFGWNDSWESVTQDKKLHWLTDALERKMPNRRTVQFLKYLYHGVFQKNRAKFMSIFYKKKTFNDPYVITTRSRVSLKDFENNFRFMIEFCIKNNIIPLIIIPTCDHARSKFPCLNEYRKILTSLISEYKISSLDLEEIFWPLYKQNISLEKFFIDPIHFSKKGNDFVASLLYKKLKSMGLWN